MALKATIFKAALQIADMDRNYYQEHQLTVARHPSETDERMMVRLLAFAMNADERLIFTKGISTDDEPDIWNKSLSGEIDCWIELGQPDEKRLRKASGRAKNVIVYLYSGRGADIWWEQNRDNLQRLSNLSVINLSDDSCKALANLAQRNMQLQCTIQDGQVWFGNDSETVEINPAIWKYAENN
ncbi:MAG: YaeQ family protein [gamma proteobacterium endosymbiont of Lamellibrachia anaximandri]|nr:YaeQ family protein [gamma proteobacterium endosymbiont of Lamellibrachia anaximandri]MBL3533442.1 YaeQ family protein [gamma proteobacterium endosymbiont of Lamellibrachia anaximandri]MBL3598869.1 YaeQ family protein [gamma proteobacterium endosymbiont of Lamellibrachia anaximandri]